jgi:signal transduction histidine kinase
MLRTSLYRRVIMIALLTSALVALGVGTFGGTFFSSVLDDERDRSFADIQNRITLLSRMLDQPQEEMLARGRVALSTMASRFGDGSGMAGLSPASLGELARRLGVGQVYLIDGSCTVVASSLPTDLGLDLSSINEPFTAFLNGLRGKGRVMDESLTVSAREGEINSYQYLSPKGSKYTLEVSSSLTEVFPEVYNGLSYAEFVGLAFNPYIKEGSLGTVASFDVVSCGGWSSWSIIRPGQRHSLDATIVEKAIAAGEYSLTSGNLRYYYRPVHYQPKGGAFADPIIAEIVVDLSSLSNFALLTLFISLAACAAAGLLALIAAKRFFDRSFVARIEALQRAMLRVASGERGLSFESEGGDEIAAIGKGIESMLDDVRAAEERLRNAKTAEAVGLMAGGLAHDINNLLAGAVGAASILRTRLEEEGNVPPEEILSSLALIEHTGERGELLVRDLLALARVDKPAPIPVDLSVLARETVDFVRASAGQGVVVELVLPAEKAEAAGSGEDLRRILLNLCKNGIQAMTDMRPPEEKRGGTLSVALGHPRRMDGSPDGAHWALSVADEGVGIPPEVLPRLFTPFYSTKSRRGGSGLGLSASKAIAEAHGGRIEVTRRPGGGSIFTLVLPAIKPRATIAGEGEAGQTEKT